MLTELRLSNMAVVEDAVLCLGPGLNVLTGSTGAGKSIVVESLRWLRGERIDRSLLRAGTERAAAEAIFDLQYVQGAGDALESVGLPAPIDDFLRVRRELRANGRSLAYVGAEQTTAGVLGAVVERLVSLQSQHQQLALLAPSEHVRLLDGCGVEPQEVKAYTQARSALLELQAQARAFREEQERIREQRELLEYQRDELRATGLREGEMEELRATVARMAGGAKLVESANRASELLEDEQRGVDRGLGAALSALAGADDVEELEEAVEQLHAAQEMVRDASRALERFLSEDELDPARLEEAQERLHLLEGLCRKYHSSEGELLSRLERLDAELEDEELDDGLPSALQARRRDAIAELADAARRLERTRKRVAKRVARDAGELLEQLGMAGATLRFELTPLVDGDSPLKIQGQRRQLAESGISRVRALVRTNPDGKEGPLEKTASGGELARFGLVLRSLAARHARPGLIILDEVDAGLGADLGGAIAARLQSLAQESQLLVITHLPAVAAAADRHFAVRKAHDDDSTRSAIEILDAKAREQELVRMLGGEAEAAAHARRLLAKTAEAT